MALQRTRRPRLCSGRSLGSPLNARSLGNRKLLSCAISVFLLCSALAAGPGTGAEGPEALPRVTVPGLAREVRVVRDDHAMPAIYAESYDDALVAQGYLMAEDRMFQLDLIRHLASGRLAELAGRGSLPSDVLFRTVGVRRIASELEAKLSPDARRTLEAFSRGIDAYIATTPAALLPIEYLFLCATPERWTLLDTCTVLVYINWNFSANLAEEVLTQRLVDRLGPQLASELFPAYSDLGPGLTSPGRPEVPRRGPRIPPTVTGLGDDPLLASIAAPLTNARLGGSNCWVVAGWKSASGTATLASDPHGGGNMIPVPFYPQTLVFPGQRITGITIVGLPGVLIGRNDWLAWGVTNNNADQQDLFIETLDPQDHERYLENGRSVPFVKRLEPVRISTGCGIFETEMIAIRETPRGPVVTQIGPDSHEALTLSWYIRDLLDGNLGLDQMITTRTPQEFLAALARWPGTTQNVHIAHETGWVGWHIMGHVPRRRLHDGLYPVPARLAEKIWDRHTVIPFAEMPHLHNPAQGWTASANHWGYPPSDPVIATSNSAPYRVLRIKERLDAPGTLSVADHRALQLDTTSLLARRVLPMLLADLAPDPDPAVRDLAAWLATWDGRAEIDSVGATLWNALYRNLLVATFEDELGVALTASYLSQGYYFQERFELLLGTPRSHWFDDVRTTALEARADMTRRAARAAITELKAALGPLVDTWSWGRIHKIFFMNPIAAEEPLRSIFGDGPYPFSGDGETLQRGAYTLTGTFEVQTNAAMRMVADLGDDCMVLGSITTGTSGRLESPYYKDQVPAYLAGTGHPYWRCDAEIEAHKSSEVLLSPPMPH
jgi:penicillin amidase